MRKHKQPSRVGSTRAPGGGNALLCAATALAVGMLVAATGCRGRDTAPAPPAPSAAAATATATPVDRTAPGELAEGTDQAFGLPIPRRMRIRARFPDTVFAIGEIPAERLANYVRARVIAGSVETGPAKTVFARATVKSAPQRMVRIEVVARDNLAELVVRDETKPPPPADNLSAEERWRRKGLTPSGQVVDPTHLE